MARKKSQKPGPGSVPEAAREQLQRFPEPVQQYLTDRAAGTVKDTSLDAILPGNEWAGVRGDLQRTGVASYRDQAGKEAMLVADFASDGKVMNIAAAVPRNPGKAYDFMQQIADFQDLLTSTSQGHNDAVDLFHKIYRNDGTTNNAINKLAALISPEGSFKVRSVRGQRGKAGDKVAEELQTALNWWKDNVNVRGEEAVITGDRGLTSFILRGVRLALIEGDHIARHVWPSKKINIPNLKPFSLPMNLQTFSARHIEIPSGLEGTNFEILYWAPPATFVQQLRNPQDENVAKILDKMLGSEVKSALIADGVYLLDPSLMIHIKNRGTGVETFGESIIEPTLSDIRYKRALDALEITTITNLINRMVIVKVGSDDHESVYHKQEVSAARLGLLQRLMRNVGPSSMVLWGGPDIEVVEVSAHNAILDLDERWRIAERRQLMSLGLPAVLMIGEGSDGKATGFSAALGVAAQLREIAYQYEQAMKGIAERISLENGYDEVDVIWEFNENLLVDQQAAADMILKMFDRGLASTQTAMEELGFDYDGERLRQETDVANGYKDEAFGPPKSVTSLKAVAGDEGGENNGGGAPPSTERTETDPRDKKERVTKKKKDEQPK